MALADGSNFGPYRILGRLGRGGMATVYRAYEPGLDRTVALKVLPEDAIDNATSVERFRREAKAVAQLVHPNIVPLLSFGIEEATQTPWMALQLIEGGALSGLLVEGGVTPRRSLGLLRGIASALDHAHGQGVLHRDVKPQNVLVAKGDHPYLADFGLARMLEASAVLSAQGTVLGTPAYMAPEQALGQPPDHRCDIYALGIVAYQMLTGAVPFMADTPLAILMKHVREPIPIPDLAEPVMRPLLKALAKNREDRWPTATSFVDALEAGLSPGASGSLSVETPTLPSARPASAPAATAPRAAAIVPPPQPRTFARTEPDVDGPTQPGAPSTSPAPRLAAPIAPPPPRAGAPPLAPRPPTSQERARAEPARPAAIAPAPAVTPAATGPAGGSGGRRTGAVLPVAGVLVVGSVLAVVALLREAPQQARPAVATPEQSVAPVIEVRANTAGASVTVDDERPIAAPADVRVGPGKHMVEVSKPGCATSRQWVQASAGERRRLDVALSCALATPQVAVATPPPTPDPTPAPTRAPTATPEPARAQGPRPGEQRSFPDGAYAWVPAGAFAMGCTAGDSECDGEESPRHRVTLTRGFWMARTETTVGQYRRAGKSAPAPSFAQTDDDPVVKVTWNEADAYCRSNGGRLPTEAEWERAARGGRDDWRYPWGNAISHENANYSGMGGRDGWTKTSPVASFAANDYGLVDMAGNVWEWCADAPRTYGSDSVDPEGSGSMRVLRGASFYNYPRHLRVSVRVVNDPGIRVDGFGFRCVRDASP